MCFNVNQKLPILAALACIRPKAEVLGYDLSLWQIQVRQDSGQPGCRIDLKWEFQLNH